MSGTGPLAEQRCRARPARSPPWPVTGGVRGAQGNDARYINHSCDPNAYTKIVTVDGLKHVAIVAARAIAAGAEVFYDYKVRGPGPGLRRYLARRMTRLTLPAVLSLRQLSRVREQAAAQSGPSSQPGPLAHSLHAGPRCGFRERPGSSSQGGCGARPARQGKPGATLTLSGCARSSRWSPTSRPCPAPAARAAAAAA